MEIPFRVVLLPLKLSFGGLSKSSSHNFATRQKLQRMALLMRTEVSVCTLTPLCLPGQAHKWVHANMSDLMVLRDRSQHTSEG